MDSEVKSRKLVLDFAKDNRDVPQLAFINEDPEGVVVTEISGQGIVNYIYRVESSDLQHSVILKYGELTVKGTPQQELTLDRQVIEYDSLQLMHCLYPGSVPQPFCFDRRHNTIAMEDMKEWSVLADDLEAGNVDQQVPVFLGQLLAKLHQQTSKSLVSAERWDELGKLRQDDMKGACTQDCFIRTYEETSNLNKYPEGGLPSYRAYATEYKALGLGEKLVNLFEKEECFIHADLHWKSIFVKDGRAALFDWEFAFLGHPAQNVAYVVESYYMYHIITQGQQGKSCEAKQRLRMQFQQATSKLLESYLAGITSYSEDQKTEFITQVALFTGAVTFASSVYVGTEMIANIADRERLLLLHKGFGLMKQHESLDTIPKLTAAIYQD